MEGTLFRVTVDATDSVIGNHMADLSWLSKFLDEHETLVEGGIMLEISSTTDLQHSPLRS